jgi:hypothetical protein
LSIIMRIVHIGVATDVPIGEAGRRDEADHGQGVEGGRRPC